MAIPLALRFLVVSLAFYGMSTFEGPMMAIKTRASGIAILQAADLVGQARIGIAVDLA